MYRWTSVLVKVAALAAPLLTACTSLPTAELTAYTTAYSDTQGITNSVLDIVAPYERITIRYANMAAGTGVSMPSSLPPPCADPIDPSNPYCYDTRLGYADIGDPPLVAAYRRLSDVVAKFNSLMV